MFQTQSNPTGLVWCHGCHANVKPRIADTGIFECPRCGCSPEQKPMLQNDRDVDVDPQQERETLRNIIDDTDTTNSGLPFKDDDLIQTPMGGRLVLNPKVSREGKNPLCPDCEQEIRRDETSNGLVEFVCGCDELQAFEFKERGGQ